jgi:hypothetical protein
MLAPLAVQRHNSAAIPVHLAAIGNPAWNAGHDHTLPKKLIEVALPRPEINDASANDERPGIGPHPKGIHH